jgi:hypothetical protein
MTKLKSIALAAALGAVLATTSVAFAQPPLDPSDPRSPGAVVTPNAAGKDIKRDMHDNEKGSDKATRDRVDGRDAARSTGSSSAGSNPSSLRPPASDGSNRY